MKLLPVDHNVATLALTENSRISYEELHEKLCHAHEEQIRVMAKRIKLQVTGKAGKCKNCAIEKAKQVNIPKEVGQAMKLGKRLCFNISSVKIVSLSRGKF